MMTVHHIGYLVKNIEKASRQFMELGWLPVSEMTYDHDRDANILFMEMGGYCIELVSPCSEQSVVSGLLKIYRNCPYHICYETDSFEEKLYDLAQNGFVQIAPPAPAPALQGRRVCFLQSAKIGMLELLEKEKLNENE